MHALQFMHQREKEEEKSRVFCLKRENFYGMLDTMDIFNRPRGLRCVGWGVYRKKPSQKKRQHVRSYNKKGKAVVVVVVVAKTRRWGRRERETENA